MAPHLIRTHGANKGLHVRTFCHTHEHWAHVHTGLHASSPPPKKKNEKNTKNTCITGDEWVEKRRINNARLPALTRWRVVLKQTQQFDRQPGGGHKIIGVVLQVCVWRRHNLKSNPDTSQGRFAQVPEMVGFSCSSVKVVTSCLALFPEDKNKIYGQNNNKKKTPKVKTVKSKCDGLCLILTAFQNTTTAGLCRLPHSETSQSSNLSLETPMPGQVRYRREPEPLIPC